MFERIKNAFGRTTAGAPLAEEGPRWVQPSRLSEWANAQGYEVQQLGAEGHGSGAFALSGRVAQYPWRIESGRPSRKFIRGQELRARAELALPADLAMMVINRTLKDTLDKIAFAAFTDSLQTVQDASLGEEVRWLTLYEEMGIPEWEGVFCDRMAVLSSDEAMVERWLEAGLRHDLVHWPDELTTPQVPMLLQVARGKLYLRMQYTPADIPTLDHAVRVLTRASEAALGACAQPE